MSENYPARNGRYWCFISYSHSDNRELGRQWATWLHHQLETYEIPQDIIGTTNDRGEEIPRQIFPVFRDEEELPAGYLRLCQLSRHERETDEVEHAALVYATAIILINSVKRA